MVHRLHGAYRVFTGYRVHRVYIGFTGFPRVHRFRVTNQPAFPHLYSGHWLT